MVALTTAALEAALGGATGGGFEGVVLTIGFLDGGPSTSDGGVLARAGLGSG